MILFPYVRKFRVDRAVKESYWEGFWACFGGWESRSCPFEYCYEPDYLKEVRKICYRGGVEGCLAALRNRDNSLASMLGRVPKIPGSVYAEAYGAARIAR